MELYFGSQNHQELARKYCDFYLTYFLKVQCHCLQIKMTNFVEFLLPNNETLLTSCDGIGLVIR